ncbi:hypothetical protein AVEN_81867-1 [Araneus ventricosus]|uniref:Uncharacterized protein n=1 Tax=Araneus ventricosus TaxID=182803 RepID=A0A4Y2QH22_ARAVE|nr:hypothetical protein AVEN_81867-1 [Araneus ventricosus]
MNLRLKSRNWYTLLKWRQAAKANTGNTCIYLWRLGSNDMQRSTSWFGDLAAISECVPTSRFQPNLNVEFTIFLNETLDEMIQKRSFRNEADGRRRAIERSDQRRRNHVKFTNIGEQHAAYYCHHRILDTYPLYPHHFFVLMNFLGALNRQLDSTSFLMIVEARSIFGEMKRQEPECANLAENAGCAHNGPHMLCAGSAS